MIAAMAEFGASMKYFSGDDCDYREYRRWKQWAINKMRVMDKLPKEARGSFIWTLLQGRALETVEHLSEAEYQKEGGEKAIFDILDKRWPEKERTDEMGENIAEVFALRAKESETLRQWSARALETFDRCSRKSGVKFPPEARGWILLNCSGMSESDRAVILARCQGSLKFDDISQSMRSCFPDYVVPKKKSFHAHLLDDLGGDEEAATTTTPGPVSSDFQDVELFLTEHGHELGEPNDENETVLEESEAAEILAATWKERRVELNKLQRGRKFSQAQEVRRSFKVDVEEVKRRSRCWKCQKIGHFARDCRNKVAAASGASSSSGNNRDHAAGSVEHLEQVPEHFVCSAGHASEEGGEATEVLLVSSPGYAVLDSGCGKTIVGAETLKQFVDIWKKEGIEVPQERHEENAFKYGNGHREVSHRSIDMPVTIGERSGVVRAAVVKGNAPLLLSRPSLKRLQARLDFDGDKLELFGATTVDVKVNSAGQYVIPVVRGHIERPQAPIVSQEQHQAEPSCHSVSFGKKHDKVKDYWEVKPNERIVIRHHRKPRKSLFTPCHTQCPIPVDRLLSNRVSQISQDNQSQQIADSWHNSLDSHRTIPGVPWTGRTVFQIGKDYDLSVYQEMPDHEVSLTQWTPQQHRQLMSQIREKGSGADQRKFAVIEVFSPPRFALECAKFGLDCISADLCTGWDFRKLEHRQLMRRLVKETPPELLVLCPPCTWAGGWFHLNRFKMDSSVVAEKEFLTRLFINFCKELAEEQLRNGGRVLFEHPKDSIAWQLLKPIIPKMHLVDLHMCCYGLKVPTGSLIRKPTRLLVSHSEMTVLAKKCPGSNHHKHCQHQPIAGSFAGVGSISKFAGRYPIAFVKAVLRSVKTIQCSAVLSVQQDNSSECLAASRIAELSAEDTEKLKSSLKKLHVNLGHPSNNHLTRILKHGGASDEAIRLSRDFQCEQCIARSPPKTPLPTQTRRVTEFNELVGIDVKYLPGWNVNQMIPCLNIIDYASSLQVVVPLYRRETAEVIRKVFMERWVSWAGPPSELVCDPAKPNIAEAFTNPLESLGTIVKITAADAHWQLGKTEVHGGWFGKIVARILSERNPSTLQEWEECVQAAHCKNQLIQVYGMTPSQFVFGKNPRVPENLLDEPLEVIPATLPLYEEANARHVATRQAARRAVLELQDERSLRLALAARPRPQQTFAAGTYVAYWRSQKWNNGTLDNTSRWYGPAIVLGYVGRNIVVLHKRNIFRCAPEQVRLSTESELKLVETPDMDLLGIKGLIEKGALDSRQFVDLVHEPVPGAGEVPSEPVVPASVDSSGPLSVLEMHQQDSNLQSAASQLPLEQRVVDTAVENKSSEEVADPEIDWQLEEPETQSKTEPSYGPVRRRLHTKAGPMSLFRPGRMATDDFQDMMKEVIPRLIENVIEGEGSSSSSNPSSSQRGTKRESEDVPDQPSKNVRMNSPVRDDSNEGATFAADEVTILSVENVAICQTEELLASEIQELHELWKSGVSTEVLLADYLQKKMAKELPHSGNSPELQKKIDEAKLAEWNTITAKHAGRLVLGDEVFEVKKRLSHRIMGSRFVLTVKQEEDAPARTKARWCLQGHLDPDLSEKASSGDLQSPTLSQVGRNLIFQLLASFQWRMRLGDIRGAFLSAGDLPAKYKPLYARLPPGGIPGVPDNALIEVLGHVYGLNDSPAAWYKKLCSELLAVGFERSQFDSCVFYMRDQGQLTGVYGIHVDDSVTGGTGEKYEGALKQLQSKFEFRKWRVGDGDFCGANYVQDPHTGEITMSQEKFAQKIKPLHFSRDRLRNRDAELNDKEVGCLRAINGSLNWLASQSRPDLATQVSFSQQSFPRPTISDALAANNAVRRAKQHADQTIRFRSIPSKSLTLMCHSDAAFGNAKSGATQAGYMVSFTHANMNQGETCDWTPMFWKSSRLPRVVSSTLSAEAQSMSLASSMCEWIALFLSEAMDGPCCPRTFWNHKDKRLVMVITDCKSLYDHLLSQSSPTLDDRRTAIDIVILRDSIDRLGASLRWIPTDRMLADSLTKESVEAFDLLRACIRSGQYQISPESNVLEMRARERDRRKKFAIKDIKET